MAIIVKSSGPALSDGCGSTINWAITIFLPSTQHKVHLNGKLSLSATCPEAGIIGRV